MNKKEIRFKTVNNLKKNETLEIIALKRWLTKIKPKLTKRTKI